jgi:hypothetical protein
VIRETPPHEVPVVCHGEWSFLTNSPRFPAFKTAGPESHVVPRSAVPSDVDLDIYLGFDHGHQDHAEVAILLAVQNLQPFPKVWVLDEYVSTEGTTNMDDDAEGIQAMLKRWGLKWCPEHIKEANGDRSHYWGGKGRKAALQRKSNDDLMGAWERLTGARPEPPIRMVKRGPANLQGAVDYGVRWLHQAMLRPDGFHVVEGCERGILSMQRYKGKPNSEWSHWIDALRYTLRRQIYEPPAQDEGPVLRVW